MRALLLVLGLAACDREAPEAIAPSRPPITASSPRVAPPRPALAEVIAIVDDDTDDADAPADDDRGDTVAAAEPGDRDSDDILDDVDRCPNAPEDNEGFDDIDGCPDVVANPQ